MYIWERPDWPNLRWQDARLIEPLAAARLKQGRLLGSMARIGFNLQLEAHLDALTEDAVKSSEIEGEVLDRVSVRSSLARHLGVPQAAVAPLDRRTEGVVEVMLDATQNYAAPLTQERLWAWQAAFSQEVGRTHQGLDPECTARHQRPGRTCHPSTQSGREQAHEL